MTRSRQGGARDEENLDQRILGPVGGQFLAVSSLLAIILEPD